ncbi:MAG TPA: amino acid ABC transporter substrate-binding protein [Thermodesulfobacteriota bacterium]|nr:amino acid ABC transporter substrate-binding protein [Thermodesulfobacteriota bacterium]
MLKIKVGISISLTGRYQIQGRESFEGLLLWAEEINKSGGIFVKQYGKRIPVKLIHYDDRSSAEECTELVERLISGDRVDILIGPYSSGLTLAAAPVSERYEKILWNHGGATDEIFEKGFKYVVSAISPASEYFNGLIEMVRKIDSQARKVAIFRAEDSGFSGMVSDGARRFSGGYGFDVTEFRYRSGTQDFSSLLGRAKEYNPDLILGAGRMEDDLLLARQILEKRVHANAIGLIAASIKEFHKALGEQSEGFLAPSQWEQGIRVKPEFGPTPDQFSATFKARYGKYPDYTAAQSYNIGLIIQRSVEETGTLEDSVLRDWTGKADFDTFYGHFKVDSASGKQVGHEVLVVQWQAGNKLIVYPEGLAETSPIYPKPIA